MMPQAVLGELVRSPACGETLEKRRGSQNVAAASDHWPLSLEAIHANRSYLALPWMLGVVSIIACQANAPDRPCLHLCSFHSCHLIACLVASYQFQHFTLTILLAAVSLLTARHQQHCCTQQSPPAPR